ncbi:MAG: endopeptidase La [Suipraeoptans sp.]
MSENYRLPLIALRGMNVLPEMVIHFDISREKSLKAIDEAMMTEQKVILVAQKNIETQEPELDDLNHIGCIATINQIIKLPNKISRILVAGEKRVVINEFIQDEPFVIAGADTLEDIINEDELNLEAKRREIIELYKVYLTRNPKTSKELVIQIEEINDFPTMINEIAANMHLPIKDSLRVLEEENVSKRYEIICEILMNENQIAQIKDEINAKVKERVDKNQREYILREQIKLIREELGDDTTINDADEFKAETDKLKAPKEVKDKLYKEIKRFRSSMNSPAEVGVIRTYIETLLDMPWDKRVKEHQNIAFARQVLDEDHYGLEKVKERIIEYLAVRAFTKKGDAPILCLVGPPGTGKTSIAKSLARALKKPYVRISLGGVRDEAEIRGHRKTYVGAMSGRIAGALKSAGVKNPLMLLDEIDKVSNDYKGDTFSALLEVLDSEQNIKFRDHYLEVGLDLSEVLFITTANTLSTIPRPLLDRMEVIEISSYTENEKMHIATEHLIPKQIKRHGLTPEQFSINNHAIGTIIRSYTKEAGVRQLERRVGDLCRKAAKEMLEDKKKSITITKRNLEHYLGKELYKYQPKNENDEIGIVRGLAWTSVGGDTLQIEVNVMPGSGELQLTGQLGDVMKESARTGVSYIRSVGKKYNIADNFFKKHDVHVHIPEGAVPKDGPSAGITMATAMLSAITGKAVRAEVAMTGEITLRGRVLPIGGLKEKLLAAKNAGITTVIIPKDNEIDVKELSTEITKGLNIVGVSNMDEVIGIAISKTEAK